MDADAQRLQVPDGRLPRLRVVKSTRSKENVSDLHAYLRGPIRIDWLDKAISLPGKTLAVGLLLWHVRALQRSLTVQLGRRERQWYAQFHLCRKTIYRGLRR